LFCACLPERLDTAPRTASDRQLPRMSAASVKLRACPVPASSTAFALTASLSRQYQVITRSQVLATGMTESALVHRLRAGGPWQRLLKDLLVRAKLPMPEFNPRLYAGEEFIGSPDAWWQYAGVAGEVDSNEYHLSPEDHERTLARDRRMRMYGINVLHFTPRQIRTQPGEVIAAIRAALANPSFRPSIPIRAVSAAAVPPGSAPHPPRSAPHPPRSAPYPASIGASPGHNGASPQSERSETPGSSR
jgi:hypothetical protein